MKTILIDGDKVKDFKQGKLHTRGEVLAEYKFENENSLIHLETNGEEDDLFLEIVEYTIREDGVFVENTFSEYIFHEDIETEQDIKDLFENWLKDKQ